MLLHRANPFLIVTRGIHKGRLAIDLSSTRSLDLKKRLTDAMSNMYGVLEACLFEMHSDSLL